MASAYIDPKKKSIFTYHKVLLFNYDVQAKKPFISYNRNLFSEDDIPASWFTGPLTPANRREVLPMKPLGGGRFSVFAKVEIGNFLKFIQCTFDTVFCSFQISQYAEFTLSRPN